MCAELKFENCLQHFASALLWMISFLQNSLCSTLVSKDLSPKGWHSTELQWHNLSPPPSLSNPYSKHFQTIFNRKANPPFYLPWSFLPTILLTCRDLPTPKQSDRVFQAWKKNPSRPFQTKQKGLPSSSSLVQIFTLFWKALLNSYLYLSILQLVKTPPFYIPPAFKRTPISLYTLL